MKVGINGFGRVGQALLQRLASTEEIEIIAINEIELSAGRAAAFLGDAASVSASGDLVYVGRTIKWLAKDDPCNIEWSTYGIEVVVEASRLFLRKEMVEQSEDGQVAILMTGDLRGELPDLTLILGVNENEYRSNKTVLCAGSDRTQALVPIFQTIGDQFGVKSYRACIHRSPYVGTCGRVQNRNDNAEQLARALPALAGRGEITRVDDPGAKFVTIWLDIAANAIVDQHQVRASMKKVASDFPQAVLCSGQLPSPVGNAHSALVDLSSIRVGVFNTEEGDEHHIWLKLYYDPVVSYAERIKEQLIFLSEQRGLVAEGTVANG